MSRSAPYALARTGGRRPSARTGAAELCLAFLGHISAARLLSRSSKLLNSPSQSYGTRLQPMRFGDAIPVKGALTFAARRARRAPGRSHAGEGKSVVRID
jgi:hypothetical protein